MSIEIDQDEFEYWPLAMANAVHLWTGDAQGRIWCVGEGAERLAEAFRAVTPQVWCTDPVGGHEPPPQARFDTIVAIPGSRTDRLEAICRRLDSGGYLFVWTTPRLAAECRSRMAGAGLRIACRYLVANSLVRPAHLVPDSAEAIVAQIAAMRGLSGLDGWARRLAVRLGWRPEIFAARLLVAQGR